MCRPASGAGGATAARGRAAPSRGEARGAEAGESSGADSCGGKKALCGRLRRELKEYQNLNRMHRQISSRCERYTVVMDFPKMT